MAYNFQAAPGATQPRDAFKLFDTNGDGKLGPSELRDGLSRLGITATPAEVDRLIASVDLNGSSNYQIIIYLILKQLKCFPKITNAFVKVTKRFSLKNLYSSCRSIHVSLFLKRR